MHFDQVQSLEEYVSDLEVFVGDSRSKDKLLLRTIELSRYYPKSYLEGMVERGSLDSKFVNDDSELFSYFADVYSTSGLGKGNYRLFLHGDENLFEKIIFDFKNSPFWEFRKGSNEIKSQPFISEKFGSYMQIEDLDKYFLNSPDDGLKQVLLIGENYGNVRIIFPGSVPKMFNPKREERGFVRQYNDACALLNISEYVLENQIPAYIVVEQEHRFEESWKKLVINLPSNLEMNFSEKEIGYKKN